MAEDCAGSLQVCAARFARLDTDGTPLIGADNMLITKDLATVSYSFELTEGEDFEQKNACGDISVAYKEQDRIKRVNLGYTSTKPAPELHYFLFGGELIYDAPGGDVIGYVPPGTGENPNPNGVSAEFFTKAIVDGAQAADLPWWWWPFVRTRWVPSDRSMGNEVHTAPFTGYTEMNENWAPGPAADWDYDVDPTHFAFVRTDDIPTAVCGLLPVTGS